MVATNLGMRLLAQLKAIADFRLVVDEAASGRNLDFFAQAIDVDMDVPSLRLRLVSPYPCEKIVVSEKHARVLRKEFEQLKLFVGQLNRLSIHLNKPLL